MTTLITAAKETTCRSLTAHKLFVLMHGYVPKMFRLVPQSELDNYCVLCTVKAKIVNKNKQQ